VHEVSDKVDGIPVHMVRHMNMGDAFRDAVIKTNLIFVRGKICLFVKGRHAAEHFENEHP
jgi:hypothetical protein